MTKIIATIGPSSRTPEVVSELYAAGVSIFRLNFSHGDFEWHGFSIDLIRKNCPGAKIMLDTDGPSIRSGDLVSPLVVNMGDTLTLVTKQEDQNPDTMHLYVNHAGFHNDVEVGTLIALDSAMIMLKVEKIEGSTIVTTVLGSGTISSRRHVNLVQKDVSLPNLTEKDHADIAFGVKHGVDLIALSFVRNKETVAEAKALVSSLGAPHMPLYSKIETQSGLDNLEEIAIVSDGIMVARGDLGVETPFEQLPAQQKKIIKISKKYGIPVIVATEMLESMIKNPRPTRAEVSDIALAVWEGADYVMLSGETAAGKYPLEAVKMMKKVVDATTSEY